MNLLDGKIAVITGGVRGIGKAISMKFAENGATIIFTGHSSMDAIVNFEKELIEKYNVNAKGYLVDASSYNDSVNFVNEIVKEFGRIDILVNNAGITRDGMIMRMSETNWDDVIDTNLKSVFNMIKAVSMPMLKARCGAIINMSSVVGINGNAGQANYAASKAGVIGLTKSIAKELGSRGIRVNAVAPGFIKTDMTSAIPENIREAWIKNIPLQREGLPDDVANAVLFLASDMSLYITGQVLPVCGGMGI